MNQIALTATGHVLVLVDGLDAFEGSEEITRVDIPAHVAQDDEKEEATFDGLLALAVGLAFIGGIWTVISG